MPFGCFTLELETGTRRAAAKEHSTEVPTDPRQFERTASSADRASVRQNSTVGAGLMSTAAT